MNVLMNVFKKLNKELVFAKIIIKNPKKLQKINEMMNYNIYQYSKGDPLKTSRSLQRTSDTQSSRKFENNIANSSFQITPHRKFELMSNSMCTSPVGAPRSITAFRSSKKIGQNVRFIDFLHR